MRVSTVGEWLDMWLELIKPDKAAKTYVSDKWRVDKHLKPRIGTVKLRDLTVLIATQMLAAMAKDGRSDSERHKAGSLLRRATRSAVIYQQLPSYPLTGFKLPNVKPEEKQSLTAEQVRAFVAAAEDFDNLGHVIQLWVDAGLRSAEMLALEWGDFDPVAGTIRVCRSLELITNTVKEPKTRKSRRTIKISASTVQELIKTRPAGAKLVVPNSDGGYFWQSNFMKKVFGPIRKEANLEWVTPYTFRHTMATLLLRAGVPVKVVSERLGHEDVMTTLRTYTHVMPGDQERAAAVMESVLVPIQESPVVGENTGQRN
ncbi:site-specific integrase [Gemmata sp. G18]|uniref:Site-specific integrase n=1 Tax=Gemmata palustris TaxID=2822762 RepID=A0ABS5C4P0_9BACT|nr:site-specific integrase [Gemmata palustris]MBP3960952.1 site-specific integrase [Gemmata palustris]